MRLPNPHQAFRFHHKNSDEVQDVHQNAEGKVRVDSTRKLQILDSSEWQLRGDELLGFEAIETQRYAGKVVQTTHGLQIFLSDGNTYLDQSLSMEGSVE
jgi:hypothetical protein